MPLIRRKPLKGLYKDSKLALQPFHLGIFHPSFNSIDKAVTIQLEILKQCTLNKQVKIKYYSNLNILHTEGQFPMFMYICQCV